ncbi:hypothetical protein QE418_003400 [Microbacterium testaceum]|uniref:hypothetical protein n=1 Tax=Microbacterium testaceum TaxID=2033 RepID=UPI0027803F81|nr:hypothetical protein [Microbacterium testaceum]MDQ1113952.1 hypothetical protein [Microbacterium testaceum]
MGDFLLEPPAGVASAAPMPAAASRREPIAGIDWAGVAAEARGEVALLEVAPGEGELQSWAARGIAR